MPSPAVSTLLWPDERAVGLWLDTHVTVLNRDLDVPVTSTTRSLPFFLTLGVDTEVIGSPDVTLAVLGGAQYGWFSQKNAEDGWAGVVGLRGSLKLSETLRLALDPSVAFGARGDNVYFVDLALEIRF